MLAIHPNARPTSAVRAEIARSGERSGVLAERYGVSTETIREWRRRGPEGRLDPARPVDLDRRTWLKLRRGLYPIDARLDLHGLTQDQAHDRLAAFLSGAHTRGSRCVLVITGRGARTGGTLRTMTPRWLDEAPLRPLVLTFAQARVEHGGEGALYVLLRRRA